MLAIDLVLKLRGAISRAEARRLISQSGLWVNGKRFFPTKTEKADELEIDVKPGDKVKIGHRETVVD